MILDQPARISGDDVDLKSYRKLAAHGNFFAIIAHCLNTPGIYEA